MYVFYFDTSIAKEVDFAWVCRAKTYWWVFLKFWKGLDVTTLNNGLDIVGDLDLGTWDISKNNDKNCPSSDA